MPDRPSLFDSPDLTYRMSMLPGATYRNPDGSERLEWALPSMITEPIDALYRLGQNSVLPDGRPGIPNPQNVENQNDVLTGLLSLYGGNAMKGVTREAMALPSLRDTAQGIYRDFKYGNEPSPIVKDRVLAGAEYAPPVSAHPAFDPPPMAGSLERGPANDTLFGSLYDVPPFDGSYGDALVEEAKKSFRPNLSVIDGGLLSDTGKPSLFGSAVAGAEANKPMRAYRGYGGRSEDEAFLYPERDMLFASSDPHTAATYANSAPNGDPVLSRYGISTQGAVAPLEMNFENPLRVDAQGSVWDQIPFNGKSWSTTDEIANLARERGHDGLILDNVRDGIGTAGNYLPPASTYVALKRGTVTSPLTGETLFSDNLPSIWGNALAPYQDEPRNALLNY